MLIGLATVGLAMGAASVARAQAADDGVGSDAACDVPVTDDLLDDVFDTGIGTDAQISGADYQRAFELDDGRVLWVFQDADVETTGGRTLVHNAGVIQDGSCFEPLFGGTLAAPRSWVGAPTTERFEHWYWPLDGYQSDHDTFVLFLAEMEERGGSYLTNTVPTATVTVDIDLSTGEIGPLEPAPDSTASLYGFDITEDDEYRYLYAQCHRQFGFGWFGHDTCTDEVTVARQPIDQPSAPLTYWDGSGWTRNSRAAENIAPQELPDGTPRGANPMQIQRDGDRWIAVTKIGDWWGDEIVFDVAPAPEGPWTTTAVIPIVPDGDRPHSTIEDGATVASYFVSFVPSDDVGHTLAVSNNRWDGQFSEWYRPRFHTVPPGLWDESEPVLLEQDHGWWVPERTAAAFVQQLARLVTS